MKYNMLLILAGVLMNVVFVSTIYGADAPFVEFYLCEQGCINSSTCSDQKQSLNGSCTSFIPCYYNDYDKKLKSTGSLQCNTRGISYTCPQGHWQQTSIASTSAPLFLCIIP